MPQNFRRIMRIERHHRFRLAIAVFAIVGMRFCDHTFATQPDVQQVVPPGGQRGSEVDLVIDGKRLDDAQELQWYDPGISVKSLEFADKKVKVKLAIAPDCPLGEHAFRLRTKTGLGDLFTFWVGTLPTVMEKEPNNDFAKPQKIDLNVTVTGVITGEDVDNFAVDAKQGQRLSIVIEGLRLGRAMFDPCVTIFDSQHHQLAYCDDQSLVRQDSIAQIDVPADGTYIVSLRDSTYGGSDKCHYRLHVGTYPQPTAVFPLGGKPGEEVEFHFLGDIKGDFTRKIRLPDAENPQFMLYPEDDQGVVAAGLPVRVSNLPNVIESELHSKMADAQPIETPSAVNGVIAKPGEVDFYRFTAKKGEVLDINCYARRLRSPLDSVIQVFRFGKNSIAENDDAGGPDSYLRFTAPEDGDYAVSVRDQLKHGGPTYGYRLELTRVAASMIVNIPKVQQFSQDRQTIVVPRGNRYAARIGVDRKDFGGDVVVSALDLPEGLTADEQTIAGSVTSAPMVFEASEEAPVGGVLATLQGRMADPKQHLVGNYSQTTELVLGDNQTVLCSRTVPHLAVIVAEHAPFKLEIVEPKVPLVQNGSLQLKVIAQRDENFKAPITLEIIHSAPGISNASNVTIPEGQSEVLFPLNANNNPGYGKWPMAVVGKATIDGGAVWVSSQLATLEVAPAYLQLTMDRTAAELGQTAEIICKIEHKKDFDGTAKAHLFGLPNKVTAPDVELTKDTTEITFPVTIDPTSPVGKHKGIGCQVVITEHDEPISQNVGSTELRIDPASAPKPAKTNAATAQTAKPAEQHLTRLEKLRQEAEQKMAGK
jgi:Bacterial pre-peptidase C-terminal domain